MDRETSVAVQGPDVLASSTDAGTVQRSIGSRAGEIIVNILRIREMAMVILILLTCVIMSIFSPYFLSLANFIAIARGFSMEGIVVVGMAMLLISGNFDLSVGSVMALSGIAAAWLMVKGNMPPAIGVLGGLAVGAAAGSINGLVVTRIGVNPLIATLGMMAIARGSALGFTSGHPVINVPMSFAWIGQGSLAGMPIPILIMVVVVLVADVLLRRGRALRQLYYVGGSQKGVPTAFAGVELRIIAACVIGGASLSGGEGTVAGALLGLIFMALVTNALTLFGVSIYWEGVVTGTILTTAVSLDMISRRRLRTS
jgi:ribose transport system permease protein